MAALKAQLATAESRCSPGPLGHAESLRVHLGQLREAAPGEEVALLEQELEQVVSWRWKKVEARNHYGITSHLLVRFVFDAM